MSGEIPKAPHAKMDSRAVLAEEFYVATNAELAPFVSDEATWYSFDYLEQSEVVEAVHAHYGLTLGGAELAWPFWQLLDYLDANRQRMT